MYFVEVSTVIKNVMRRKISFWFEKKFINVDVMFDIKIKFLIFIIMFTIEIVLSELITSLFRKM